MERWGARARLALAVVAFGLFVPFRAWGASGDLDPEFGVGGKVVTPIGSYDSIAAIAIQTDGAIIAAGSALLPVGGYQVALARYLTNGDLDPSFGFGGIVT